LSVTYLNVELQHFFASRRFVSDSWAFLLTNVTNHTLTLSQRIAWRKWKI